MLFARLSVPRRTRPGRRRSPHRGCRDGLAPILLPVSSIPDDELLAAAEQGKLRDPSILEQQVRRMLADQRSKALVTNFAGQWLYLRISTDHARPRRISRLRRRSAEVLPTGNRIVRGSDHARKPQRGGFAGFRFHVSQRAAGAFLRNSRRPRPRFSPRHAGRRGSWRPARTSSILTVTSYPNRTSVVQRGEVGSRERARHASAASAGQRPDLKSHTDDGKCLICASRWSCIARMPSAPDVTPAWTPSGLRSKFRRRRQMAIQDAGSEIDASGSLPDGTKFNGPAQLKKALLGHRDGLSPPWRETAHLCARPRSRILRSTGCKVDRAGSCPRRLPFFVARERHRQEYAVSDEENTMIITKKALPRRTFLRGIAPLGAAASRRHGARIRRDTE